MFKYLGVARCEFLNEKTGEVISGWHVWLAEPAEAPSAGLIPGKKWLTDAEYDALIGPMGGAEALAKHAGKDVQVIISLKGKLKSITFPQAQK